MKNYYNLLLKYFKKEKTEKDTLLSDIKNALLEVNRANMNFQFATGSDNVELAILELNASLKRYQNLIKEAKEKNITKDFLIKENERGVI